MFITEKFKRFKGQKEFKNIIHINHSQLTANTLMYIFSETFLTFPICVLFFSIFIYVFKDFIYLF